MAMAIAATMVLLRRDEPRRCWVLDALAAGAVSPCATYLLLRVVIDLPGAMAQGWWGLVLLLLGGAISVLYPWQAAQHPDLDGSVACLTRRQAGLAIIGLGLTLIARSADLPDAASFALAATLLLAIASGAAGTLACLAAQAIGHEAGSWRMVRLGGLIRSMPIASVSLAASLLALVALPPGVGFAAMWLLFQSILSAPRTGGLLTQLPLALIAATLALSSALAIAASVRMIGIAILSRPRSVRGSAARDVGPGPRQILLTLSGISILLGALPGVALKALVAPAISFVTGTGLGGHAGWATLATYAGSPGYSALPVAALLALALGSVMFIVRRFRQQTKLADVWNDGLPASSDLPFGDPHSQSAGAGFLPALPAIGSTAARSSTADSASPGGLNARLRHLKSLDGISSCNLPAAESGCAQFCSPSALCCSCFRSSTVADRTDEPRRVAVRRNVARHSDAARGSGYGRRHGVAGCSSGRPRRTSVLLPWRDLVRLSRKTAVLPESASPVLSLAPAVGLSATICAAALVPSFTLGTALAPLADGMVVASLLSLARVAATLGALDTGSALAESRPSGAARAGDHGRTRAAAVRIHPGVDGRQLQPGPHHRPAARGHVASGRRVRAFADRPAGPRLRGHLRYIDRTGAGLQRDRPGRVACSPSGCDVWCGSI